MFEDFENKKDDEILKEFWNYPKNKLTQDTLLYYPSGHKEATDQQYLINQFNYILVLVSPLRRAIQTAVDILKTHP